VVISVTDGVEQAGEELGGLGIGQALEELEVEV
jgi:hypothetical protein